MDAAFVRWGLALVAALAGWLGSSWTSHAPRAGEAERAASANARPRVELTSPADGAVFASTATITIEAFASDSDGTITLVEFFDGGTSLGVDPSPPFRIVFTLAPGAHILSARATDNAGTSSTSPAVTVSVLGGQTRPAVRITRPTEGDIFTSPSSVLIEATASDPGAAIAQVEFYADSAFLGSDLVAPYSFTAKLPAGPHQLTVRAINIRGVSAISESTTSEPVNIVVTPAQTALIITKIEIVGSNIRLSWAGGPPPLSSNARRGSLTLSGRVRPRQMSAQRPCRCRRRSGFFESLGNSKFNKSESLPFLGNLARIRASYPSVGSHNQLVFRGKEFSPQAILRATKHQLIVRPYTRSASTVPALNNQRQIRSDNL